MGLTALLEAIDLNLIACVIVGCVGDVVVFSFSLSVRHAELLTQCF